MLVVHTIEPQVVSQGAPNLQYGARSFHTVEESDTTIDLYRQREHFLQVMIFKSLSQKHEHIFFSIDDGPTIRATPFDFSLILIYLLKLLKHCCYRELTSLPTDITISTFI